MKLFLLCVFLAFPLFGMQLPTDYVEKIKEPKPLFDNLAKAIIRADEQAVEELINKENLNHGYSDNAALLLGPPANPNRGNHTALMIAALYGKVTIVKKLLIAGANPNLQTNQKHTALTLCTKHTDVFEALLKGKADPNIKTFLGNTALIYSIMKQNKDQAALLLCHGADPKIRNDLGFSAEDYASMAGAEFTKLLASFSAHNIRSNCSVKIAADNQIMAEIQQEM